MCLIYILFKIHLHDDKKPLADILNSHCAKTKEKKEVKFSIQSIGGYEG